MYHNVETKRRRMDENSFILWHKRLGHIFSEKLERLIKNKILSNLGITDLGMCMNCIKESDTPKRVPQEVQNYLK